MCVTCHCVSLYHLLLASCHDYVLGCHRVLRCTACQFIAMCWLLVSRYLCLVSDVNVMHDSGVIEKRCEYLMSISFYVYIIIIIYPLTARVVGAPHTISQPVFSIFPCSPLPSRTCRTPGLSIPWCCLPTSSSVCPVFFPLSLCLARWFWPDLMNGRYDHTTAICVSLRSSGGLCVVRLPVGSWHRPLL